MSHVVIEPLALPAIHASHAGTWLRDPSGTTRGCSKGEAIMAAADTPLLLLNAPLVANRLGYPDLSGLDLLELFAFVHPARFCVPTPRGLAHALGLDEPGSEDRVPLLLQQAAARIDYAHEESNFTLALATLGAQLSRRSLIVLFTEFTDPTSAELMIRAAGRLVKQHRLLCVVLKDAELEGVERMEPSEPADLVRTNVAAALLRDRRIVIARLQRMGVDVVEVAHDRINSGVLDAWLAIKKAGSL